jgi:hypothetical protein
VLIARLAAELRCCRPEVIEEDWAVLRCLGQRRDALVTGATRCRQQITGRLALAWPAVLGAAAAPLESMTFLACLQAVAGRCDGDPGTLRRYGLAEFTQIVRGCCRPGAGSGSATGSWPASTPCWMIAAARCPPGGEAR